MKDNGAANYLRKYIEYVQEGMEGTFTPSLVVTNE